MSIEERPSRGARRFQRRARQEADKEALKALRDLPGTLRFRTLH